MKYLLCFFSLALIFSCQRQKETIGTFVDTGDIQLIAPTYKIDSVFFKNKATVAFTFAYPNSEIRYTTDGSEVTAASPLYTHPFNVRKSCKVKAKVFHEDFKTSDIVEFDAKQLKHNISKAIITIAPSPGNNYTANGTKSLVDAKSGTLQFRNSDRWLGFNKDEVVINLSLPKKLELSKLIVHQMTSQNSWIFSPQKIAVFSGSKLIGQYLNETAAEKFPGDASLNFIEIPIEQATYESFKIVVHNLEKIPDWHPAANQTPWLFIDEIIVE
ncbi:chitobiase/beta-hexosaminidase C-terminal domain-containing protein [Cellulophaga sp. F20128]|uniref:chitobiase/beta-hexosaminidase C-terminal domain-containing protein n=1 Tax=Cellulophaga sp. F20128 TaxID=2926413 RepID=UPI001FF2270E|nr:chitobiase/beta-hexosaminidase C-terminal domain-containing protein [Cellulophaga sp. F20128]MCK0156427.1 chitobiase/beta-hexosaminidase C-terminal domain-containing protein [Cellulophaga sp. F20128]